MLELNHVKEGVSRASVLAIGHQARVAVSINSFEFDYGIDGQFSELQKVRGRLCHSGEHVDFQLKATTDWKVIEGTIRYPLSVKEYDDLVNRKNALDSGNSGTPKVLLVHCLGGNDLVSCNLEDTKIHGPVFWFYPPNNDFADTEETKTIQIPLQNHVTPQAVLDLLKRRRNGGF